MVFGIGGILPLVFLARTNVQIDGDQSLLTGKARTVG